MILYITSGCETGVIAGRFRSAYPDAELVIVPDDEAARRELFEKEAHGGKHHIFITPARGQHFKVCPGTEKPYICCQYWTLHQATNCPFDCSYCILQYYLNNPLLTVYANVDDLKEMIRSRIAEEPQRLFRVGTGELADSLALDDVAQVGCELIRFAAEQPNMILELKTKSGNVDHLLGAEHRGKTVISWSLNPVDRIERHEFRAASLETRMAALRKVQDAGYMTGFHFDPMLLYDGWEKGYEALVRTLFDHAAPERIAWISIGSLRFPPEMADKVRAKFPRTDLLDGEMIRGRDNKSRYFKPLRIDMYRHLYSLLRAYGGKDLFVYFCMEDADVWKRVMGFAPEGNEHLDYLFAEHLTSKFPNLTLPRPDRESYRNFITRRSWE
ncbi:MAG: DNA photolyase [Candidatus Marinimicrobia bacterium]|nr:DNA photolyase [Candidatus Neomarinimicrobiota bacterium]